MSDDDATEGNDGTGDKAKYESLFRFHPYGVVLTKDRLIVEANAAAVALFGAGTEANLVGRRWLDLVDPLYREISTARRYALERGDSLPPAQLRMYRIDGTPIDVETTSLLLRMDGETQFLAVLRDVSDIRQAQEALEASEARFRGLIETAVDGIVLIDTEGSIQLMNPAAGQMFGYEPEEVTGRNVKMLMPGAYAEEHDSYIANYIGTGEAKIIGTGRQVEGLRRDGSTFPVHLSVGETTVDGKRYFTGFLRDETATVEERRRREESEETYRRLSFLSPAAVLVHIGGKIVYASLRAAQFFDLDEPHHLIGREVLDFYHPEERERIRELRRQILEGADREARASEVRMVTSTGRLLFAQGAAAPIRWNGQDAMLLVLLDISELKQAELDLKRSNDELLRSNEELARFAYVASHDLKEPLRMVSSYCALIESRFADKIDESGREFIHFAVDGAKRMQKLIDDLLQYSRIGRAGGRTERFGLGEVTAAALRNLSVAIEESGAEIAVGELPEVNGLKIEFLQLFQNLIGNAIKFRSNDPPRIRIAAERDGASWRIEVRDNGIGIEPHFAERIFGVFQRLHPRESYEGTGIGLAICEKVVTRHGGRIWVEPAEGGGSRFIFTVSGS